MSEKTVTYNLKVKSPLDEQVMSYKAEHLSLTSRTDAVVELLDKGLKYDKKVTELENLLQESVLATFHLLRQVAVARPDGESFLKECDLDYKECREEIRKIVVEWGIPFDERD